MLKVVHDESEPNDNTSGSSLLDEIVRDGARQMLAAALQAEVAAYIEAHAGELDEAGHRLVVRNGYHAEREVTTAAGAVPVRAPRVNDKRVDEATGDPAGVGQEVPAGGRGAAAAVPARPVQWRLRSGTRGVSGHCHGLSASVITRLTKDWQAEAAAFIKRVLNDTDYVYAQRSVDTTRPISHSCIQRVS
jgi:putative transposase